MISKAIEGSITKTSIKKLRIHCGEYVWIDTGVIIVNHGPAMLYLFFFKASTQLQVLIFQT